MSTGCCYLQYNLNMADQLTEEQIAHCKEIFETFGVKRTKDEATTITSKQMTKLMTLLGLKPTETDQLDVIKIVDLDGNGTIDFSQCLVLVARQVKQEKRASIQRFYDKGNNGFVSPVELRQVIADFGLKCTEDEVNELVREADTKGDGQINYNEFIKFRET